ncbi:MAG: hypothetical protein WCR31_03865 [Treponema sp.]
MSDPFYKKIHALYAEQHLPSYEELLKIADRTASVLEAEDESYCPSARNGKPGALLDFTKLPELPLIVVPDLHARVYFLLNVLDFVPAEGFFDKYLKGKSVLEALELGAVRVVCVGDALHAEQRARERWLEALQDFDNGVIDGKAMREEMEEGLTLLELVMTCKCRFPATFHFLKGNHENITNRHGGGDFPFCKFADEGEMVMRFIRHVYGDDVLHIISYCEDILPLIAAFPGCIISHAEPRRAFTRDELINARQNPEVVAGLTWTENAGAEEGSVKAIMCGLLGSTGPDHAVYLAGHRPVPGRYALRQEGLFIQFHNTEMQNIALVVPGKKFNPDTGIVPVIDDY